jgi:RNA polymerase sigma-70 factor, ECF subfamily
MHSIKSFKNLLENEKLISDLKQRSPKALEELYNLFKNKVYNTVISYIQNLSDAEEITQDIFIEIFRSIHKFKSESNLSTWIYRITVNKSLDFIRYTKRKKRISFVTRIFKSDTGEFNIDVPDFIHPGIEMEMRESSAILFKAIDMLPENQKTAFILSKIEGLSNNEISEVMKTSLSSVESLLFRAKQNLRKYLSSKFDELY